MKGNRSAAQEFAVELLRKLSVFDRQKVLADARQKLANNSVAIELLNLVALEACDPYTVSYDFVALAKTILVRQESKATNKAIMTAMFGEQYTPKSVNTLLGRIQDRSKQISYEQIKNLCSGFKHESDRLYWENRVLLQFPEIRTADVIDGPVLDCLSAVWNSLTADMQKDAYKNSSVYADWIKKLISEFDPKSDMPKKLYDFFDVACKRANISKTRMISELNMDEGTYIAYKKAWQRFESDEVGCGNYPVRGLTPRQLLRLAVFLNMDYFTAAGMLSVAGYSFHKCYAYVAEYLLDPENHSKGDILGRL